MPEGLGIRLGPILLQTNPVLDEVAGPVEAVVVPVLSEPSQALISKRAANTNTVNIHVFFIETSRQTPV